MEAITIKPQLWEEVKLPKSSKVICIEVASEVELDFGVVDQKNLDIFYNASSDKNVKKVEWFEQNSKLRRFDIELDLSTDYYLILWNAYSKNKIFVAYNWFIKE